MSRRPEEAVRDLRARIGATLAPLLEGAAPFSLLEYPEYPNPGDGAIWLGTLEFLRRRGLPLPVYTTEVRTYRPEEMTRRLGRRGTVLLQGGGSFGDVWPAMQAFRESVIRSVPDHPVVQLPQTIHFDDPGALARTARVMDAHPRLTLLVRDLQSEATARSAFQAAVALCPDLALMLDLPPASSRLPNRILWLARTDQEARHGAAPPTDLGPDVVVRDWITPPRTRLYRRLSRRSRRLRRRAWVSPLRRQRLESVYEPVARERLQYAVSVLDQGRVVVTDRLHGHILCLLRRQPHILLDNRYGKVSRFFDTWTRDVDGVSRADAPADALARARALLDPGPGA